MTAHPNRSKWGRRNPMPAEVRALRAESGLTQAQFGELVHTTGRVVMQWEADLPDPKARRMHPAFWELINIKLGTRRQRT